MDEEQSNYKSFWDAWGKLTDDAKRMAATDIWNTTSILDEEEEPEEFKRILDKFDKEKRMAAFGHSASYKEELPMRLHVSDWNYQDKCYDTTEEVLRGFRKRILEPGPDDKVPNDAWDWFIGQVEEGIVAKRSYGIEDASLFFDYEEPRGSVSEWAVRGDLEEAE